MIWYIFKIFISALIIVLASETAKHNDKLGSLITSLPMISIITMLWMYAEKQTADKIANHAWYTFWYVLPSLPMFLIFPFLINKFGFKTAMVASVIITFICFRCTILFMNRFDI